MKTGAVEDSLAEDKLAEFWKGKNEELNLIKAKKVYDEGCIHGAARLGLPKAQYEVSDWYYSGMKGT